MTAPATVAALGLAITPRPTADARRRTRRDARRRVMLLASDSIVLLACVIGSSLVIAGSASAAIAVELTALVLVWLLALALLRTRDTALTATREYRRVAAASALAFAALACVIAFVPSPTGRLLLLVTLPLTTSALLASRWFWRSGAPRRLRRAAPRTLLVGSRADLVALMPTLAAGRRLAYDLVGTTLIDADAVPGEQGPGGVPVFGPASATAQAARLAQAETVIVVTAVSDPDFVRRLSWQLEGTAAHLVVATALRDVAPNRITLSTVTDLALVDVRIPTYDGVPHRVKRVLDVISAVCALVPIALVSPIVAALIRLDSPGPVLFRQRRVGRDGREFDIVKFRTMRVGAEQEREALLQEDEGAGALFKIRRDPRITRVGGFLRKYSIDELPQFWNVLRGDMSVVGPRPPLPREVDDYDDPVFRRLYLRPGITGPWQIGGRSDLTWEQSVRLDLHYIENWSVACDLRIMLRTAVVVLRAKGAY